MGTPALKDTKWVGIRLPKQIHKEAKKKAADLEMPLERFIITAIAKNTKTKE